MRLAQATNLSSKAPRARARATFKVGAVTRTREYWRTVDMPEIQPQRTATGHEEVFPSWFADQKSRKPRTRGAFLKTTNADYFAAAATFGALGALAFSLTSVALLPMRLRR